MKRRVCIITGSRSEYGLLRPLAEEIKKSKGLRLQIIATGMHMCPEFGLTYKEIEKDGFRIDSKIDISLDSDRPVSVARSMGIAMRELSLGYERLRPDIIVLLGDRFEILSAATAALISGMPIAHIHGGEITEGSLDDAMRHSITKISHLHFTSTESYRRRVIQLGEEQRRVFNVGALGLDNIRSMRLLSKKGLEEELGVRFKKHNLLVTLHPETLAGDSPEKLTRELLTALHELEDTFIIFTKANADTGGRTINRMIESYAAKNHDKAILLASMGQLRYLSAMKFVDGVVGNSSSGIIEAPSFKIGTINIGDRQKGRIKAESVIDCKAEKVSIRKAIKKLYSQKFQQRLKEVSNPYGNGSASRKIARILGSYNINGVLKKRFIDLDF